MTAPALHADRGFLFLQGPHGPFFDRLAGRLRESGAACWRVGFNRGDQAFWSDAPSYLPHRGSPADWPGRLHDIVQRLPVTDIVLYGDTRPVHADAVAIARALRLRVHVFEEGYIRPYWVTLEQGGSNGNSPVMTMALDQMRAVVPPGTADPAERQVPARWGDLRQHVFYGAAYHFYVLVANHGYAGFQPHRAVTVSQEFRLYLRKLALLPFHAIERTLATRRVRLGGFSYHLVLLQLDHDASFRNHGPFADTPEFVRTCLQGFAGGADAGDHLVFKAHPLDDGRAPLRPLLRLMGEQLGIAGRVHYLRGGKLAHLLDGALSAVTVNSTAGQQALWRGLPLKAFGRAVYARPPITSDQPLAEFFASPRPPDAAAYADLRRYLLATSQLPGGFYSARGRRRLVPVAAVRMLQAPPAAPADRPRPPARDAAQAQQSATP